MSEEKCAHLRLTILSKPGQPNASIYCRVCGAGVVIPKEFAAEISVEEHIRQTLGDAAVQMWRSLVSDMKTEGEA